MPTGLDKFIRLPFNDVPSFVGMLATVVLMTWVAKRLPVVKNLK